MLLKLFLAFTLIPVIELYLLIQIGSIMGAASTIVLVILTGAAGAWLARMQGVKTMMQVQHRMQAGEMPAEEMIDAVIIFAAGVVLLTPGLLTDIAGLLLPFPATRLIFKQWLRQRIEEMVDNRTITIHRTPGE